MGALAKESYPLVESLSPTFEVEHFLNCELESESEASWYGLGLPAMRRPSFRSKKWPKQDRLESK